MAFVMTMMVLFKGVFFMGRHRRRCAHNPRARRGERRRSGFGRAAGEAFKRGLRVDEDQEDIIDHAFADLQATLRDVGGSLKDSRGDLAAAFGGEEVDDGALDAIFSRHDEDIARARHEIVSALKQIHAVLDPDQRGRASDWLGSARGLY